jgi:hypothetical protein
MIQGNLLIEHLSSNYCYCNSISQPVVSDALTGIGEVVLSSSFMSEKKYRIQYTSFQASAAKQMRTVFFWYFTQRTTVVSYRHFGTAYRFNGQAKTLEDGTDMLARKVGKELPLLAAS